MKHRKILIVLSSLMLVMTSSVRGDGEDPEMQDDLQTGQIVNSKGTEFTVMFMSNEGRREDETYDLQLFITTQLDFEVTVTVSMPLYILNGKKIMETVKVKRGRVAEVNLDQRCSQYGAGKSNRGVYILATNEIAVYGINPQRYSSEGFILLPNHALGEEYFAVSMPAETKHTQLAVTAVQNNTLINITLPDDATLRCRVGNRIYRAGESITATLRKYETFQVQHENSRKFLHVGDLSGARIYCTPACSAFSGNSRTSVNGTSRDHLIEQLPPNQAWGKIFAIPPTPGRFDRPDILKFVCQQDGTLIKIANETLECNRAGRLELEVSTDRVHLVTATKPVLAAHVVMSQSGRNADVQADPAMTLIIPEEQYDVAYTMATATWSGKDGESYDNYITVVIRRDSSDQLLIDGKSLAQTYPEVEWKVVPSVNGDAEESNPLVSTSFLVPSGTHTVRTVDGVQPFLCVIYGAGDRESYAYLAGMRLELINPPCTQTLQVEDDGVDNDCDAVIDEELCDGTDDDEDGLIDEDCTRKDAIKGDPDLTIQEGRRAKFTWVVFAKNWAQYKTLIMTKVQPSNEGNETSTVGSGHNLRLSRKFMNTGRYNIQMTQPVRRGNLQVFEVTLDISRATTQDMGGYTLTYTTEGGPLSHTSNLRVNKNHQKYQLVAVPMDGGETQSHFANIRQRDFNFIDGFNYTLYFRSHGGLHATEVPYSVKIRNTDRSDDFTTNGLMAILGPGEAGLRDVSRYYELAMNWTADITFDGAKWEVHKTDKSFAIDGILNVEERAQPYIETSQELVDGKHVMTVTIFDQLDPATHTYSWTLPYKEEDEPRRTIQPGANVPLFTASEPMQNDDGSVTLKLTTPKQFYNRKIDFNTESVAPRQTWRGQADFDINGSGGPSITSDMQRVGNNYVLYARIHDQLTPATNTYTWTLPGGVQIPAGSSHGNYTASNYVTLRGGTIELTLTTPVDELNRTVDFLTESSNDYGEWTGEANYDLAGVENEDCRCECVCDGRSRKRRSIEDETPQLKQEKTILDSNSTFIWLLTLTSTVVLSNIIMGVVMHQIHNANKKHVNVS